MFNTCPACGAAIDIATEGRIPVPGDIVLCLGCCVYLMITFAAPGLRLVTNAEWVNLPIGERVALTRLRESARSVTK